MQTIKELRAAVASAQAAKSLNKAELPEVVDTNEAARRLNRRPQTLRRWACLEDGPVRPIRINGRLAWLVSDLAVLLTGGDK